ncbi:N-formylglutamate amidohydrolase [Tatumella morbirosei]|uniref:N-formylglutamate amidohydrolase n=1 Tax=Tatumella morbirosei TaxID=642227 RepID=A0A095UCF8_9GAMM|nr:N-formylglutamate deformylase [Tatumella morbirosei]KGD72098.1 N-formylglutamate amidohydrolase [Tatumella morbirosei]
MSETEHYIFHQGNKPLLITMPHTGTVIPEYIAERMTHKARSVPDTDWHIEKLYAFARESGASILQAKWSRYVVDLNRPPDDISLYPGQVTTGLCFVNRFDGGAVYTKGNNPDAGEIADRREKYWQPWHNKLQNTLTEMREEFSTVVMWDAHSIRSELPQFFSGKLPDINIGTNDGLSCHFDLQQKIFNIASQSPPLTVVSNGRYKGGYNTRHYAQPDLGTHTLQMELTQSSYMQEIPPWYWDEKKAVFLQNSLKRMIDAAIEFAS